VPKVKPVGEPDALVGHVRFDERGTETESWYDGSGAAGLRKATQTTGVLMATAPFFDSTLTWMDRAANTLDVLEL